MSLPNKARGRSARMSLVGYLAYVALVGVWCHGRTFSTPCGVVMLAHSQPVLRGNQTHIHFSFDFVALSDLSQGLSSPTEHILCGTQACSATRHCMFNYLRPNQFASTLCQVIRLDLASTWGQGLSTQRCISTSSRQKFFHLWAQGLLHKS